MKKILSLVFTLLMILSCAVVVSAAKNGFSDVEEGRWSEASVSYAVNKGYMNGVGGGLFDPEGSLTRAMVATVLWRREKSPAPAAPSGFDDVPAGEWYSGAVAWAKGMGVVKGLTETAFGPDEPITREQLATMLFRFSSGAPVSVPERADLEPFADDEKVSDWATEPLEWAVEAGLIKGTDGNRLAPDGFATREQFAAIIERYDDTFTLKYNTPVIRSHYTEKEYPLVTDADVYVAADGDDTSDGSFSHPFRTWERARDAVRALDKTGRDGIKVAFMAGDYGPLSIELTAEDSGTPECPITYCKYGDGDVVFNNGIDITADDFSAIDAGERALFQEKFADDIKKADVSALFDAGLDGDSLLLFSDGALCTVARYPNKWDDGTDQLVYGGATENFSQMKITNPVLHKKLSGYSEAEIVGMKLYGYLMYGWEKTYLKTSSYDSENGLLTMNDAENPYGRLRVPWDGADGKGIRMCVSDVSKELDHAGEYWIGRDTRTLYVYAPTGSYHIPVRGDMIVMERTDNVTFRGLTFRNTTGSFIRGSYCHGVTVDRSCFSVVSSNAGVLFEGCDVGRDLDLTFTDNSFSLAYGQSVKVYGTCSGQYRYSKHANVVFDNNLVTSSNLAYDFLNAVHLESCSDLLVTHNDFIHSSRGAVSFDLSYNVLVEYNNFDSVMENSEDGGAVYSYHNVDGWNLTVRRNFFNRIHADGTGSYGYYVDDYTGGADIYENLFYEVPSPVMIHNGRDNTVHDNIFISLYGWKGVSVSHGMRYDADAYGNDHVIALDITNQWRRVFDLIETYPEYRAGVEKWCPGILDCHMDFDKMDDDGFYLNPVNTIRDNVYFNPDGAPQTPFGDDAQYHEKYVTVEGSRGFALDSNPCFVNPTRGDYRIRVGADFPDIHFENIGRY